MFEQQVLLRYAPQMLLADWDEAGQVKLSQSQIVMIGLGGLGQIAAQYLCAAGAGNLVLVDNDYVSLSNLSRQTLFRTEDVGQLKVEVAKHALNALNPLCEVLACPQQANADNLPELLRGADVVLDCTDNLHSRQAINQACYQQSKVLLSAAAIGHSGQFIAINPKQNGGCYCCLYGEEQVAASVCNSQGVLGPVVAMMGLMQALEALKYLTGYAKVTFGQLHLFDGKSLCWQTLNLNPDPTCAVCGGKNADLA